MVVSKCEKKSLSLLEKYRKAAKKRAALPPFELLVFSQLSEGVDPDVAWPRFHALREGFINWNEMRVARRAEIARLIDPLPDADDRAARLRHMLNKLFEVRGAMELDFLAELKVNDARKQLNDLDGDLAKDAVNTILFQLCPGTIIPITAEGLVTARKEGLLGRGGNKQQLQKILQAELTMLEAGELLQYLEMAAGTGSGPSQPKRKKK